VEPQDADRGPQAPWAAAQPPPPGRGCVGRRLAPGAALLASAALTLLVSPGGPGLVSIVSPRAGEVVGLEGVHVMARLPDDARVAPETLRVLLNGADVTRELDTGQNGAVGRLHGLLDGENVLRIEVEASSWWSDGRRFESGREVRFLVRPPLDTNRG
jgi:hypothetical protein